MTKNWMDDEPAEYPQIREMLDGPPPPDPDDPGPVAEPAREPDDRPVIVVEKNNEHEIVAQAIRLLAGDDRVYRHGEELATVRPRTRFELPTIAALSEPRIRTLLSEHAWWGKPVKRKEGSVVEGCGVPAPVVSQVWAAGVWPGVRQLEGLSTTPIIRPDGQVRWTEGYDEELGTYYTPVGETPEQTLWTQRAAAACREHLLDVVADFPWATEVDADVWLAGLLAPLVRCWSGPCPMVAVTSASAGTGKGLLVDVIGTIILGRAPSKTAWTDNQEELEKRILASALSGTQIIMLDNLPSGGNVQGTVVDMAATSDRIFSRILRESRMVDVPLRACWYLTGNNLGTRGDTARRTLVARIVSAHERPEERTDMREPELLRYVEKHRDSLLVDAVTIVAGYLKAGCPEAPQPLGSFTTWSRVIRGAVLWAGGHDVVRNLGSRLSDADQEAACQRRVLRILLLAGGEYGVTVQRLIRCATPPDQDEDVEGLLEELAPSKRGKYHAKQVTAALTAMKDRPRLVDGRLLRLEQMVDEEHPGQVKTDATGWPLWRVVEIGR